MERARDFKEAFKLMLNGILQPDWKAYRLEEVYDERSSFLARDEYERRMKIWKGMQPFPSGPIEK